MVRRGVTVFYTQNLILQYLSIQYSYKLTHYKIICFCQLIPEETVHCYKLPVYGNSLLWKRDLQQPIQGGYHYRWNGRLVFVQCMDDLVVEENIAQGTLVMVEIQRKTNTIRLDLVEDLRL